MWQLLSGHRGSTVFEREKYKLVGNQTGDQTILRSFCNFLEHRDHFVVNPKPSVENFPLAAGPPRVHDSHTLLIQPRNISQNHFSKHFVRMNLYGVDFSLFDHGYIDDPAFMYSRSRGHMDMEEENLLKLSNSILKNIKRTESPPKHRHDGTSPLPLGMDWSQPPTNWNGRNTIWPHDFHTGWSYCVSIPSWSIFSELGGSEPVVFYQVQVGLQSPEGVTTIRPVQRRFSDFLKLSTDLKRSFRKKKLPPAPAKGVLRTKSRPQLEERRRYLEEWMAKVLSDMDFSRSAPIACFLELEAAARSSFDESSHHMSQINLSCNSGSSSDLLLSHSGVSMDASSPALASNQNEGSTCETTEIGPIKHVNNIRRSVSGYNLANPSEAAVNDAFREDITGPVESTPSRCSESIEASEIHDGISNSDLQFLNDVIVVIPTDQRQKVKRLFNNMQEQLVTSKTDVENLVARLNQELAVKEYLTTKVKDLETELESSTNSGKEKLEQAIIIERERNTQMQWDMEELKRTAMEMKLRFKAGQDEKAQAEATKKTIIQENEALRNELDSARQQLENLQKCREETELKSKSNVKLVAEEVKSLRNSQSELKQELDRLAKENIEFERILQQEKQNKEHINAVNAKLLHEYKTLSARLEECSVNFLIEENKLKIDGYSPSEVLDLLETSENRIRLLLAEAQLLSQEAEIPLENKDEMATDDELRKMMTDVFIDNAMLRKRINDVMRCAISMPETFI